MWATTRIAASVAALMFAIPAEASDLMTVSQYFNSYFVPHGSIGPVSVGALNLPYGRTIQSAVINYTLGQSYTQNFYAPSGPVTAKMGGAAGFQIMSTDLPVPIGLSVPIGGNATCDQSSCSGSFIASGSLNISHDDLPLFAGSNTLILGPVGQLTLNISGASTPLYQTGSFYSSVYGTINYVIAVPESGTWALMIIGMGAVGYAMRRQKPVTRLLSAV